jgi:hypothetical protein
MLNKQKKIAVIAVAGIITAFVAAYFTPTSTNTTITPIESHDEETPRAIDAALKFVRGSPTFAFDGIEDTLKLETVNMMKSLPEQYNIIVSFDTRHDGFGNREGQILAQIITPRTMSIIISEGQVISAITDGVWDEISSQYVLEKPGI